MTEQRLEVVELVRRIHIGQQAFATIHRDVRRAYYVHVQVFEEFQHLQSAFRQTPDDRRMAGASVDCTQWMISAFGPRHDGIHGIGEREQAPQEIGRNKRHITGEHDDAVVPRGRKGRVEAAKRAALGHAIRDTTKSLEVIEWTAPDNHDIVRELTKLIELPIENSTSTNTQRALVAAAEAARATTGENCGACHS